jgi:hypothetical protein
MAGLHPFATPKPRRRQLPASRPLTTMPRRAGRSGHRGERIGPATGPARQLFEPEDAEAFDSYEVLVDSKKLTSCSVSFAAAIHFAGLVTL